MAELIKLEPGKSKLYLGVDDNEVDDSPQEFEWTWIKAATKLRKKGSFVEHLEAGRFGIYKKIGIHSYEFQEGHRAICRFNNERFEHTHNTIIMSMDDYESSICGRELENGVVIVRGAEYTGKPSIEKFNPEEFFALPRYTSGQCKMMATERVERDISEKAVGWHDLPVKGYEFKTKWEARYSLFYGTLRKEMVLVAKRGASQQQIDDAIDLPPSILALIARKLTLAESEYYIARMVEYIETNPQAMSNPSINYKVHQATLEEINIERLRNLQRLHGDNVNPSIEKALNDALTRYWKLVPKDAISDAKPKNNYNAAPPSKENSHQDNDRNDDGMF